jgi:hypothetical protein
VTCARFGIGIAILLRTPDRYKPMTRDKMPGFNAISLSKRYRAAPQRISKRAAVEVVGRADHSNESG